MKYSLRDTLEMIAWVFLSIASILIMIEGHKRFPKSMVDGIALTGWQMALYIIVIIAINTLVVYWLMKTWKKMSMGWKILIGSFGAGLVLGSIAITAVDGFALAAKVYGVTVHDTWWMNLGAVIIFVAIVLYLRDVAHDVYEKNWIWRAVVRANNVFVILVITYVGAAIAFKLEPLYAIIFIVLLAIYDAWAVWIKGSMQVMAVGMMKVGFIPGLGVPRSQVKRGELPMAILGGGDIFIIAVVGGSLLNAGMGVLPILGMLAAVIGLFLLAKPKKFYPAIPYILGGLLVGVLASAVI